MASLCSAGPDCLLVSSGRDRCIAGFYTPVCVSSVPRRECGYDSVRGTRKCGALPRISRRDGGAAGAGVGIGIARESKFRVECSETQTVVSVDATEGAKIICEACRGVGFRICDYCEGMKVNVPVKGRANRFHRRCPECRAVGIMMCYRCKVFKCVTFPDWDDGSLEKAK